MERRSGRNWRFIAGAGILLSILIGLLAYTVIPLLLTYEQLAVWGFGGWTANSAGQVTQATFIFINNGTRTLTISGFSINGTKLNSTEWFAGSGLTLVTSGSRGPTGTEVVIVPATLIFNKDSYFDFSVETTSGKKYSHVVRCDNDSVSPENLTIQNWEFVPGFGSDWPEYIGIRYRNNGKTPIIITNVTLNSQAANTNRPLPQWTRPASADDSIMIYCNWNAGQTYLIRIETAADNEYQLQVTAPTN